MRDEPYKTHLPHLADMQSYVGKELGLTEWIEVTQERVNQFAEATEDLQWIHTDPEMAAKHSPYGRTIAHGFWVLSMASRFVELTVEIDDVGMGLNYGLDRVRFPNATPVGGRIRARVGLMELKEIPGGAHFKVQVTVEVEGEEKPACVAEFIARSFVKPA